MSVSQTQKRTQAEDEPPDDERVGVGRDGPAVDGADEGGHGAGVAQAVLVVVGGVLPDVQVVPLLVHALQLGERQHHGAAAREEVRAVRVGGDGADDELAGPEGADAVLDSGSDLGGLGDEMLDGNSQGLIFLFCVCECGPYLVPALVGGEAGERAQGRIQKGLLLVAKGIVQLCTLR